MASSTLFSSVKKIEVVGIATFVAKEKFREGTTDGVKIKSIGPNFKKDFYGKKEKNVPAAVLCVQTLDKESSDHQTLRELGGTKETFMAHCWELLKGEGLEGSFTAFALSKKNDLVYVEFSPSPDGFKIESYPVEYLHPKYRDADSRVVSTESV